MTNLEQPRRDAGERRGLLLTGLVLALLGAATLVYLHGPEVRSLSEYHGDMTQSPHWVAYHGDAFAEGDLLVEYATYNESPVQNLVYWLGTLLFDVVLFNKGVGIAIYGLTAALVFFLVTGLSDRRTGLLASLFFMIFPRSSYEIAGGFSKAWAIGFVMITVYVIEKRSWHVLLWTMPLAALAYPVAPVLMGAVVFVGLVLEAPRAFDEALRGLRYLVGASALAILPLLYKYLTPPERIGDMIPAETMKRMWARGMNTDVTIPLWEEVLSYFSHPFFIYGTILLLILLARRGLVWRRSWTALVIASSICYYVAYLVAPRLYLPDRYTRFSIAVLLVLWHAFNWSRVLESVKRPGPRRAALAVIVILAAFWFPVAFRPSDGDKRLGRWEERGVVADLSRVVAQSPSRVLVAGHPYYTGDVMVQARRPVLVIHRMIHAWFSTYRSEMTRRVRDTFAALYARDRENVDRLAEQYGVTHLVVPKNIYGSRRLRKGSIYNRVEFGDFILRIARGPDTFVLNPPPRSSVLFEDRRFWLVQLPLGGSARTDDAEGSLPEPRQGVPRKAS